MADIRSVVVTGASTGIGRAAVSELVRAGLHVWATVRREADAEALRQDHSRCCRLRRSGASWRST